jgi:predicted nucleic acid-binding protein
MIVVADTSPINYLVLIGQIDVLEMLYQSVLIPTAVHDELLSAKAPAAVRIWIRQPPLWLTVHTIKIIEDPSAAYLDLGEKEAIQLAEEVGAEQIILDDLAGRREAFRRGLPVIGTLGVLRQAAQLGLLDIHSAIQSLQGTTFKMSPEIVEDLLREFQ